MKTLLAVALLYALAVTVAGECTRRERQDFEARAVAAEASNKVLLAQADADAEDHRAHVQESARLRAANRHLAAQLAVERDSLDAVADTVFQVVPAGCASVVEIAERYRALYGKQEVVLAGLWQVIHEDSLALAARGREVTGLRAANDTLRVALASRPKARRWFGLLPKPAVVVGYGATITGVVLRTGPSVTAGWTIRF